jgi:hypothetical protein
LVADDIAKIRGVPVAAAEERMEPRHGLNTSGEIGDEIIAVVPKRLGGDRLHRRQLNAARMARSLGTGGATGLGSIVYALAVMSFMLAVNYRFVVRSPCWTSSRTPSAARFLGRKPN